MALLGQTVGKGRDGTEAPSSINRTSTIMCVVISDGLPLYFATFHQDPWIIVWENSEKHKN